MGEAKRRREAQQRLRGRDFTTGREVVGRFAEVTPTELLEQLDHPTKSGCNVPCNGCQSCCWYHQIEVRPEEESAESLRHLAIEPDGEGGFVLKKRDDGACIHLGDRGCSVYPHRPRDCRNYDCRVAGLFGIVAAYAGNHHSPAWVFVPQTFEDRAILLAARMASLPYLSQQTKGEPISETVDVMTTKALQRLFEKLPEAREVMTKMDAMPPEQRDQMAAAGSSGAAEERLRTDTETTPVYDGYYISRAPRQDGCWTIVLAQEVHTSTTCMTASGEPGAVLKPGDFVVLWPDDKSRPVSGAEFHKLFRPLPDRWVQRGKYIAPTTVHDALLAGGGVEINR